MPIRIHLLLVVLYTLFTDYTGLIASLKTSQKKFNLFYFELNRRFKIIFKEDFFSTQAMRYASLNYCKNQNIYGNTEQVKRLVRLHKALNEAQFTSQLNKGEYLELLDSSIPKGTLSEILKLEKSRTSV